MRFTLQEEILGLIDFHKAFDSLELGFLVNCLKVMILLLGYIFRIIFFLPKFCHITPVLVRLHWLPIKSRIHFKICLITKLLHGLSPSYLFDLISVKKTRYSLRSFQAPVLNRPRTNRKTLGDRSFVAAAPTLWNALPQEIRQCQNINVFKCPLKTHLFTLAYNV